MKHPVALVLVLTTLALGSTSWGQSVVGGPNRSACPQHYSNANGTVGSIQGSRGGTAIGASTDRGSGFAGKTAGGDMYAGRNGNVYKNTGSGWSSYNNGSWNPVSTSSKNAQLPQTSNRSSGADRTTVQERSSSFGQTRASSGFGDVDRSFQNRQRGGASSERYSGFQRSGGGGRSSAGRGGGRRR